MKITARPLNSEDMDVEISMTMSLYDWKQLKNQMAEDRYPSWKLHRAISDCITKINNQVSDEISLSED